MSRMLKDQAAELERQRQRIQELEELLKRADQERCELIVQNQKLFEEKAEAEYNFRFVSDMYDQVVARGQAAEGALRNERRKFDERAVRQQSWTRASYPALSEAEEWFVNHEGSTPIGQHLEVPVLCLRWTQDKINSKMMFRDDDSVFKLVDQLLRGTRAPSDIRKRLDVAHYSGQLRSLSNRRLSALMMYQALHRDRTVRVWCRICNSDTERFERANDTTTEGWASRPETQHFGAPLFRRGEYVLHELNNLAQRHQDSSELIELLRSLKARGSAREVDGASLTLTAASQSAPQATSRRPASAAPPRRANRRA